MMTVDFLALPVAKQLELLASHGRVRPSRWETDYYVALYYLPTNLLVEVRYHLHSGLLYQLRVCSIN
ncbi:hypothetical protein FNT36_14300 [Hymenobacter setariae]|uniref:Uncharacterized protein n=1 Tax=Hymenobacter setariae TaxID=2594794 RepID=A0A558BVS4_9BACT|nr:hypothetical protein [Hymenobacter setariae]TVT40636.1 hypothetical protein FNT36_14300 [Hymenobacter setariae]